MEHLRELLPHAEWWVVEKFIEYLLGAGVVATLVGFVQKIKGGDLDWWILSAVFVLSVVLLFIVKSGGRDATGLLTQSSAKQEEAPQFPQWPTPYRPVSVVGKTFRNERVLLDGHSYSSCLFENVTIVYNGTTPIQFSHNTVTGSLVLASDNVAIYGAMLWMKGFELLKPEVGVLPPSGSTEE